MGNEDKSISTKMKNLVHISFILPMCRFAESFNLSVATAITLSYMNSSWSISK